MKRTALTLALTLLSALFAIQGLVAQTAPPKYTDDAFMTTERRQAFQNLRMYEVMVESFVDGDPAHDSLDGYGTSHHKGDIKGIIQSLDYIKSMGFNSLWVTPFFMTEGNTKMDTTGYYIVDYFAVDPKFGTMDDARELVKQAHARGIYIFFDAVFGHNKATGVKPSPSGLVPQTTVVNGFGKTLFQKDGKASAETLAFYKEVAAYWIKELAIDGWRLDVAYELYQGKHIYWEEIRHTVQDLAMDRAKAGEKWGTLGYMVAETWKGPKDIAEATYGNDTNRGVWSAFDFPGRYKLVQVFATEEGKNNQEALADAAFLDEIIASHDTYPSWAIPHLFLGNHDLVRFGDLIQRAEGLGYGPENPDYWKRHKAAFNYMAAYTGPIMIYYGEEIGDELKAYGDGPDFAQRVTSSRAAEWGVADDHVSRTSGKVEGINATLNAQQKNLKAYLTSLFKLRAAHPVLSTGERQNLKAEGPLYADLKISPQETILYVQNVSPEAQTLELPLETAKKLTPLLGNKAPTKTSGAWTFKLTGLEGQFFLVQ